MVRHSLVAVLLACVFIPACSNNRGSQWFSFRSRESNEKHLQMALESKTPDERRRGVEGLAESDDATEEWAIKVFDTIARTDTDAMVRVAAIRALRPSANADRVPMLLKLLRSSDEAFEDVRPAPSPVRWAAARLLFIIVQDFAYADEQQSEITKTLVDRVHVERDHNVRLTLIDTLGFLPDRAAITALIGVMASNDYAVKHAAELALVSLTGVTHDHEPAAWQAWLDRTADPFEHAGETPTEWAGEPEKKRWDWLEWW